MMALRVAVALIWILVLLVGRGLFLQDASSGVPGASSWTKTAPSTTVFDDRHDDSSRDPAPAGEPRYDIYGNEVENAVADYRIDPQGGVYERHSPETAVARLGAPTS